MPINVKKTLLKARNLTRKGDVTGAAQLYNEVLQQYPHNKQAAQGLASLQNSVAPAGQGQGQALQRKIEHLVNLYNGGHLEQALQQGQLLAAEHPDEPIVHNVLGAANSALSNYQAAVASFSKAVQLMPDYAEAYNNLGTAYNELGRNSDAAACYNKVIQLQPGFAEAYNNLGNVYKESGSYEEAIANYRKAIELQPGFADAHNNLGTALGEVKKYEEAIAARSAALEYKPDFPTARAARLYQQAQICDWQAIEAEKACLADLGINGDAVVPFTLLALEDNPARQRKRAENFAQNKYGNPVPPGFARPAQRPERLCIGYFSADFHNHATMFLMARLFELHDKSRFSIHIYSYGPVHNDGMANRLKAVADVFHDVRDLSDTEIAGLARSEGIAIAVDLKGYTQHTRSGIFAYRAAPLQINYLGYPGTMGAPFIDYIIADEIVIPREQSAHYAENIIYLPHSYQVNDDTREISQQALSRADAGLPEAGFIFSCFNNGYKVGPNEYDVWMRLLQQVEGSILWLLESNPCAQESLLLEAEKRGVARQRVIFAEKVALSEHLARLQLADLFLDTFNCNAHTTASDALWGGLPVLTLAGEGFAARVAASLLHAVGLPELVTNSAKEYEELALELALHPDRLSQLRNKLAANRLTMPLFDSQLFTTHIEDAYEQVYQRYLDGKPPATLSVIDKNAPTD